jgi:3-hydroxybutyryl-CoA dehydratase
MNIGETLPILVKKISQESINAYAGATGDFNPIHVDEEFARKTPFKGTIAHGFYIFGFISELMTRHFGKMWIQSGSTDVRFKKPVKPGDTISLKATLVDRKIIENQPYLELDVVWENQMQAPVISGKAYVMEDSGNK